MKIKMSCIIMIALSLSSCLRRSTDEGVSAAQTSTSVMMDDAAGREVDRADITPVTRDTRERLPSLDQFNDSVKAKIQDLVCLTHFTCLDEALPTRYLRLLARTSTWVECQEDLAQFYLGFQLITQEEIDVGLIEYHPESALACLELLSRASEEMTCRELLSLMDQINSYDSICDDAVISLQSVGEPCSDHKHCVGSAVCDLSGEMMCEISQCVPNDREDQLLRGDGQSCEHRECARGLYCGRDELCAPPRLVAEGEECDIDGPLFCSRGLVCSLYATPFIRSYTCQPPIAEGDPCFIAYNCQRGLTCTGIDYELSTAGQCTPLAGEGEPCGAFDRYECQRHLTCRSTNESSGVCTSDHTQCPLPVE